MRDNVSTTFGRGASNKNSGGQNTSKIWRDFWQLSILIAIANICGADPNNEYLSSTYQLKPLPFEQKIVNFGPPAKKLQACMLTHPNGLFRETITLRGVAPSNFFMPCNPLTVFLVGLAASQASGLALPHISSSIFFTQFGPRSRPWCQTSTSVLGFMISTLVSNLCLGLELYDLCLGVKPLHHPWSLWSLTWPQTSAWSLDTMISALASNLYLGLGYCDLCLGLKPQPRPWTLWSLPWSQTFTSVMGTVISALVSDLSLGLWLL